MLAYWLNAILPCSITTALFTGTSLNALVKLLIPPSLIGLPIWLLAVKRSLHLEQCVTWSAARPSFEEQEDTSECYSRTFLPPLQLPRESINTVIRTDHTLRASLLSHLARLAEIAPRFTKSTLSHQAYRTLSGSPTKSSALYVTCFCNIRNGSLQPGSIRTSSNTV